MPVSEEYLEYVLDQITIEGDISARSMFGGYGVFMDNKMFGIVSDDVLYLKADNQNRQDYERAGMHPFRPYKDQSRIMSYYEVPADILESVTELEPWVEKALGAARRG